MTSPSCCSNRNRQASPAAARCRRLQLANDEIIIGERSASMRQMVSRTRASALPFALSPRRNPLPGLPLMLNTHLACVQVGQLPMAPRRGRLPLWRPRRRAVWWHAGAVEGALLMHDPPPACAQSIPCMPLLLCACGAVVAWSSQRERVTGVRADPGERSDPMHDV